MTDADPTRPIETFVVECFWPGATAASVRVAVQRLRSVCNDLGATSGSVAWRGATFVPSDEALSCRFEGTEAVVRSVFHLAGVGYDRVLATVDLPDDGLRGHVAM